MAAISKAKELVSSNPLVIFSKSYCPYCARVKQLFSSLGAKSRIVELDLENDGPELQSALAELSGQTSVPNVFIGGNHIGGCDKTVAKHEAGQLLPLLQDAKAI